MSPGSTLAPPAAVAAALFALAALGACGGGRDAASEGSTEPLVVGLPIAKSGFGSAFDGPPAIGAEIAAAEINAGGGVLGRKIRLVSADNKSDPNQAQRAGQEVLDEGAQFVAASCNLDTGGPAARVAGESQVVAMSMCAGSPLFGPQGVNPYAFTMGTVGPTVGAAMAEWAYRQKRLRRPYLLVDTSIGYSKEMCQFFEQSWRRVSGGSPLAGRDTFQNSDKTIAGQVSKLKSATATDAVVLCSYLPGGVTAVRQLRAGGVEVPIVTGDGMDGDSWLKAVPNLSGFFQTVAASVYGDDPNPKVNAFVKRYEQRTGKRPEGSYALFGYDTLRALELAARRARTVDGDELKAALEGFRDVPMLVGSTTFTPERHFSLQRPMKVVQVQRGKPSYLATVRPQHVTDPFAR
jgi:branched-chain amino acid transport system substrate-binding protein